MVKVSLAGFGNMTDAVLALGAYHTRHWHRETLRQSGQRLTHMTAHGFPLVEGMHGAFCRDVDAVCSTLESSDRI